MKIGPSSVKMMHITGYLASLVVWDWLRQRVTGPIFEAVDFRSTLAGHWYVYYLTGVALLADQLGFGSHVDFPNT